MSKIIILVSDLDDAKHGEVSVLHDPQEAARMVESLLESGFEQERIRVFAGDEMEMKVSHRPVVALVTGDAPLAEEKEVQAAGPADAPPEGEEEKEKVAVNSSAISAGKEEDTTPFVKNGVRFSSLFRPA